MIITTEIHYSASDIAKRCCGCAYLSMYDLHRVKEAKKVGVCIFRDDNHREKILDIIDDYLDGVAALEDKSNEK